jgi:hypothetical protein
MFPQCAGHHWRLQEHATITGVTPRHTFESARGARSTRALETARTNQEKKEEYAPSV